MFNFNKTVRRSIVRKNILYDIRCVMCCSHSICLKCTVKPFPLVEKMMKYLNPDCCSVGGGWAQEKHCRPQRCGRSVKVTDSVGTSLTLPPIVIFLFLHIPCFSHLLSLSLPSFISPFSGIFLDLLHCCHFQLHNLICAKTDEGWRRWKSLPPTHTHTCSHMQQSPGPNLKIYNKQAPLLLEKLSSHLCMCACVCVPLRPLGFAVRPDSFLDDSSVVSF